MLTVVFDLSSNTFTMLGLPVEPGKNSITLASKVTNSPISVDKIERESDLKRRISGKCEVTMCNSPVITFYGESQ
jgi:hypothetical protein